MLEPSHIVVQPFKSLKTFKVFVKRIWLLHIPSYSWPNDWTKLADIFLGNPWVT